MKSSNSIALTLTLIAMSGCNKHSQPVQPDTRGIGEQALDREIEKAETPAERQSLENSRDHAKVG